MTLSPNTDIHPPRSVMLVRGAEAVLAPLSSFLCYHRFHPRILLDFRIQKILCCPKGRSTQLIGSITKARPPMNSGLSSPLSTPARRSAVQFWNETTPEPAASWISTSDRGCNFAARDTLANREKPSSESFRTKFQNNRFPFLRFARSGGPKVSTKSPNWSTVDDFDVLSRGRLPKTRANTYSSAAFTAVAVRIFLPPIRRRQAAEDFSKQNLLGHAERVAQLSVLPLEQFPPSEFSTKSRVEYLAALLGSAFESWFGSSTTACRPPLASAERTR